MAIATNNKFLVKKCSSVILLISKILIEKGTYDLIGGG
jgi:hypothetical protein